MKVLGICLSAGKGGLELYAQQAITALQNAGHACHFALAPDSFLSQRNWSMTIVEMQPAVRQIPLLTARKLAVYIDKHQIDIIHMHWNKDLPLVTLAKVLSRRKPKLVYTRHMEITRSKKDIYHRMLYRQVDLMLVNAKFVLDQALRYLPLRPEQVSLLYLGVKTSMPATAEDCDRLLPKFSNDDNRFVIGMMGRIEHYKGQHLLLEALTVLRKQDLHPAVVMAGAVMDQVYFDKLIRQIQEQGLSENIKYIGITQELGKLMSCCDVVVLTTYRETFGLVLAEAMRVGTAVIGSNAGGVPEIIRHNETGMLFEPGNPEQLATCLSDLQRNPTKRASLSKAGKAYADKMFGEKEHYASLEKSFVALCSD